MAGLPPGLFDFLNPQGGDAGGLLGNMQSSGGLLDRMHQAVVSNPDTFMGMGLGLLSGGNKQEQFRNAAAGYSHGSERDQAQRMSAAMMSSAYAALRARGMSDADAKAAILNPKMMEALLPSAVPKYDAASNGQQYGNFNPATGQTNMTGASPKFEQIDPEKNTGFVTPPMGRPAPPPPMGRPSGMPPAPTGAMQPPAPGGFDARFGGATPPVPGATPVRTESFGTGAGFTPVTSGGPPKPPPAYEWVDKNNPALGHRPIVGSSAYNEMAGKMADDFRSDKNIQRYQISAPVLESMKDAVRRKGGAADLNLVYGLAKLFDPESVVREGEQTLVRQTPGLPDRVMGMIQAVQNGQQLTDTARRSIMAEAESRVKSLGRAHDVAFGHYTDRARSMGIDPGMVTYNPAQQQPTAPGTTSTGVPYRVIQ